MGSLELSFLETKVDNREFKGLYSFPGGAGASRLGCQGPSWWGEEMEKEESVTLSDTFMLAQW